MSMPQRVLRAAPPTPDCAASSICTDQLGLRYGARTVLDGVTLNLARGQVTALVGPSGCGKTSFLHCLNRLVDLTPGAATAGAIRLEGRDVRSPDTDVVALRRRVGLIFQKPTPFAHSIAANLEGPLREHGVRDRTERAERMEAALREVGLWDEVKDRLRHSALALSGGQQQRLCIARALALRPEVLLMDEPCSALDPISSSVVEELIARLCPRYTVAVVTHNLAQARRLADWAALFWVEDGVGKMIETASAQSFFESPQHLLTAAYVRGARG